MNLTMDVMAATDGLGPQAAIVTAGDASKYFKRIICPGC